MIKNQNKSQKELPQAPEDVKHKKKSGTKGLPRSKHKHQYETVLLHSDYLLTKPHDPNPWRVVRDSATKVCVICGRIGDRDDTYYNSDTGYIFVGNIKVYNGPKLSEDVYKLDRWFCDDIKEKFAYQKGCESDEH